MKLNTNHLDALREFLEGLQRLYVETGIKLPNATCFVIEDDDIWVEIARDSATGDYYLVSD